ncbi:MAG: HDOD domain-containing protein [Planctomycetes bacterium]|nr:HDOD domain-containing protein [Planctomycetota bacterium]
MEIVIGLLALVVLGMTAGLGYFYFRQDASETATGAAKRPAPAAAAPSKTLPAKAAPENPAETAPRGQVLIEVDEEETEDASPDRVLIAYGEAGAPLHARRRLAEIDEPSEEVKEKRIRLDEEVIEEIKDKLTEIPPLPLVVTRIVEELSNPKSSAKSVAEIAVSDPVLASTLLRAINSSFYGILNEIADVRQAVALLGFDTVQTLVMQFGLAKLFKSKDGEVGYNTEDLWIHSLCVSLVAQTLARKIPGLDTGFVSTFGLLHDIGKLAINSKFPDKVSRLFEEAASGESFLRREERLFGADHAFIGAFLGREWDLPEDLTTAIQWHHFPKFTPMEKFDDRVRRALMLVHIANQIAKFCHVYCEDMELDLVPDPFFEALGLAPSLEELIRPEVKQAINRGIFFVDQITDRPLRAVQRILHTRTAKQLTDLSRVPMQTPAMKRVRIRPIPPIEEALSSEPRVVELTGPGSAKAPTFSGEWDVLFISPADEKLFRRLISHVREAFVQSGLPKEIRFPFHFLVKFVLGNVLSMARGGEVTKVRICHTESVAALLFESDALSFNRVIDIEIIRARQGEDVARLRCQAVLAAGLGNVLTLDWVHRVTADPTGSRLLLYRKRTK